MMATDLPSTMRSLALASYTKPANYGVATVPVPTLEPTDVLIRVQAAGINPGDVKLASGAFAFMLTAQFPYKIGHDLSGTIVAMGELVEGFSIGDEVFTMLPITRGGAASEYAVSSFTRLSRKPASISHTSAAALPQVYVSALQALKKADSHLAGGLAGKTIFVPAGLSGTGSAAIVLAKRHYHVGKIITTVSSGKLALLATMLGADTVDQVIDYTVSNPLDVIPPQSVDFYFDTVSTAMTHLSLLKPRTGVIVSMTSICSGAAMQSLLPTPLYMRILLDLVSSINRWRAARWHVYFDAHLTVLAHRDLDQIALWAQDGTISAVVGRSAKLSDIDAIKDACAALYIGKGAVGKFVIEID